MKKILTSFTMVVMFITLVMSPINAQNNYWTLENEYFVLNFDAVGNTLDSEVLVDVKPNPTFYNSDNTVLGIVPVNNQIRVKYVQIDDFMGTPLYGYQVYTGAEWLTLNTLKYQSEDLEPILNGETAFVTNYDNPISESEIRSHLSAYDDVDGDLTHAIQLTSATYDPATASLGQYELNYSVSDLSGNTTTLKVYVLVKDVSAPTVSLPSNHSSISYTQTFNVEALKSSIQTEVIDNFDSNINVNVVVKSNSYTASKTIPGSYPITFELTDTSGNKSEYVYTVNVIDDVEPIVTYQETIVKPSQSTMTLQDIMADITATDIISGNVTSSLQVISDGYTGNGNRVGTYPIEFSVNDSAGNYTYFAVNVQVLDDIPPVFMLSPGQFIRVQDIVTLSNEDFVDILVKTGQLTLPAGTSYMMLINEYEGNESMPGIYAVSMKFMAPTGETEIESFAVQVLETEALDGVIDDTRDLYTKVIDYVKANPIESGIAFVAALVVLGIMGYLAFAKHDHKPAYARKTKYSKYRRK